MNPVITAPLSRFLAVADVDRSVRFYRDMLGFEARPPEGEHGFPAAVELVLGQARIQIGVSDAAWDSTGEKRPRGSAILFFETADVAALRDAVLARGGKPSELERVNWIKLRMFEIRDPDGHSLWFGQSFQEPDVPAPEPMLRKSLPELPVSDVPGAVAHYRDVLGFRINHAQDDIGVMDRDQVTVILIPRTAQHRGIGSCYVYIRDADGLHAELTARGARVLEQPVSMPWGLRQFRVLDQDGNQITFGQSFE
jgi:catechol 2,3-dioxygenase-like lactoylglutathione lyase family enzyme